MSQPTKLQGHRIVAGVRVWSIKRGWGTVTYIHEEESEPAVVYPIRVTFDFEQNHSRTYAPSGKADMTDAGPELFWAKLEFDLPEPPQEGEEEYKALLLIANTKNVTISSNWYVSVEEANAAIDTFAYKVLCLISETGRTRSKHHV